MSGHSKWKNIAHKKEKTDAQRAKVFTKLSREIIVAVREGGPDLTANPRLKDVIAKARAGNVPTDNIKRVIERAAGSGAGDNYESIQYEGYGPAGVAVIVETMTDNRNRTASEMRHYFDKNGGNLGAPNSVSWSFDPKGVLVIEREDRDEDETMLEALDAGAADFSAEDEVFEIHTAPDDLGAVRDALEKKGYTFLSAQVEQVPQTYAKLTDEDQLKNMQRLLDMLEDNDDVQNVWHNWEE
ncbi:MAG: YebC/PmpR family DNA-binding transcriptional regulator [Oscillospiraceae bacterium]|jgi:YebC/PmpR family DNA-binding regulatory protein|nr:YebC/PmpR family DNA-binding transcriptional regulator [Oscillospiraceae bacterium]